MMCAISPFERVLGEAGGSLALAIANGEVKWPDSQDRADAMSMQLRKLALECMNVDAEQRPEIEIILNKAVALE